MSPTQSAFTISLLDERGIVSIIVQDATPASNLTLLVAQSGSIHAGTAVDAVSALLAFILKMSNATPEQLLEQISYHLTQGEYSSLNSMEDILTDLDNTEDKP